MTPKEAEAYTRARWRFPATYVRDLDSYGTDQFRIYLHPVKRKWSDADGYIKMFQEDDSPSGRLKAWLAAAEFTKQREEEIRQKQAEIAWLSDEVASSLDMTQQGTENGDIFIAGFGAKALATQSRILATLEAQLAALLVGMKETP